MKALLFAELSLIFTSSILLSTLLFYNCLSEIHLLVIGVLGVLLAYVVVGLEYAPGPTTLVLYFFLSFFAFGFLLYNLAVNLVYNFGPESRDIMVEKVIRAELKSLTRFAERSKTEFGSYEFVCRHEGFSFTPLAIDAAFAKESCYGPLGYLLFGDKTPKNTFQCVASAESWRVTNQIPGSSQYLCLDTDKTVRVIDAPVEGTTRCVVK